MNTKNLSAAKHTPGPQQPWSQMSDEERAEIYFEASLRIHDIDWYRFHGVDPRQQHDERGSV